MSNAASPTYPSSASSKFSCFFTVATSPQCRDIVTNIVRKVAGLLGSSFSSPATTSRQDQLPHRLLWYRCRLQRVPCTARPSILQLDNAQARNGQRPGAQMDNAQASNLMVDGLPADIDFDDGIAIFRPCRTVARQCRPWAMSPLAHLITSPLKLDWPKILLNGDAIMYEVI
jgi:hypothetical protein